MAEAMSPEQFREQYSNVFDANERWNNMDTPKGELYDWDPTQPISKSLLSL